MVMAQAIIITLSLSWNHQNHSAFRLFAANGQLLAQTYQHLDCDIPLRGIKLAYFVLYLKIINTFLKNDICIL